MQLCQPLEECAVCYEQVEERGIINCCQHIFCLGCIVRWSRSNPTCPLCKRIFTSITKEVVTQQSSGEVEPTTLTIPQQQKQISTDSLYPYHFNTATVYTSNQLTDRYRMGNACTFSFSNTRRSGIGSMSMSVRMTNFI
eukprot:TRINITY_DN936_c0_g2_i1.p1 TRINITY_DN936_c0_g2~~TRINITY_DN936_c0_g2_i1.p1  ORF type:complete len:139 (-),score=9.38 TRINITY_DN936_c0_g2_i1:333-749(-)